MKYSFKPLLILSPLLILVGNVERLELLADPLPSSEAGEQHKSFADENHQDNVIPSSPMELMHLLQRSSAMDNATSPADAIEEALKAFNDQSEEVPSVKN